MGPRERKVVAVGAASGNAQRQVTRPRRPALPGRRHHSLPALLASVSTRRRPKFIFELQAWLITAHSSSQRMQTQNTPAADRTLPAASRGRHHESGPGRTHSSRGRGSAGRRRGAHAATSGGSTGGTTSAIAPVAGKEHSAPADVHSASAGPARTIMPIKLAPKPRLTHFLSIPLGHHAALRTAISTLTNGLLAAQPPIPGLDASIVIPPRRLHLTLGVLSLASAPPPSASNTITSASIGTPTLPAPMPSLAAARALLDTLRPRVHTLLGPEPLRVPLTRMDIMPPERRDPARAHVLWVGPRPAGAEYARLRRVCTFVQTEFLRAGLLVDEGRELKLHCTVLNTTYRKPRARGARVPFSYAAILDSGAVFVPVPGISLPPSSSAAVDSAVAASTSASSPARPHAPARTPADVDLGTWPADEVQLCEMGSWAPDGAYVCVARVPLFASPSASV